MPIRKAQVSDIPALQELLQQILLVHHQARPDIFKAKGSKFSNEELEKILSQESTPIFVFENESGGILCHLFCSINEPVSPVLNPIKTLFIEDLCVNEKARGQKVGEQLYRFVEDYAREIGCYNLTLNVWNDNVGALDFYERLALQAQETVMEKIL